MTNQRVVLAATILASALAFIDGSVVNVGLPALQQALGGEAADLPWVINGYLLPLTALLLTGGAAGDQFGFRRLLTAGIVLFALASVLCAAAATLPWLVAGRVLQGVGAAMLVPNSLALLGASFSDEARGRAIGLWAAVGAAASALGPLAGGWLIDTLGWRSMFLVNLPVAAAALALTALLPADGARESGRRLDLAGAALATAGLAALTWALTVATSPGPARPLSTTASAVFGAAALGAFLLVERRRREAAMMPLSLFASLPFNALTLYTLLLYGALGSLFVLIPYVLIEAAGASATLAGAALLPLPLVIAVLSPVFGRLAGRIGARWPLTAGAFVVAGGFLLSTRIAGDGSSWAVALPGIIVIACGVSLVIAPLTAAVLSSVEPRQTGVASGFNNAVSRLGGLAATAMLGPVLAAHGEALTGSYRVACVIAAGAAVAAGLSSLFGLSAVARR